MEGRAMPRTRMLARLVIPVLSATALQTLVAGEPVSTTPPATSVREWKTTASPAPAASTPTAPTLVGEPVSATSPAASIREWKTTASPTPAASPAAAPTGKTLAAGEPVSPTPPATSIREWKTTASPTAGPCLTATPLAAAAAKPAASAAEPKTPITITFTSTLREGNLVVVLDDVPIFNEKFHKPVLLISQTTTWDPLQVAAGPHRLSAKVYGPKKTYFSKTYDLQVSRTKGSALRFVMQGDHLTVELAS
jgi:hypothetical protein